MVRLYHRLVLASREPVVLRCWAVDRWAEHDEQGLRDMLREWIPREVDWTVLEHMGQRAAERGWDELLPAFVQRYARESAQVADEMRVERRVIALLRPDRQVADVVFAVFAGLDHASTFAQQAAAWQLLSRWSEPADHRAIVRSAPPMTPMVVDLQAATEVLGVLPTTPEGLVWLSRLRSKGRADGDANVWDEASGVAGSLTESQRRGLALRHLPVLLHVPGEWLDMRWGMLHAEVASHLANARHVVRRDRMPVNWSESLADHVHRLAWGDLLAIRLVQYSLADLALVGELFAQADADHDDASSEHGGVLTFCDEGVVMAKSFAPEVRLHDHAYVAPPALFDALHTGLAHYHFHAQQHDNAVHAGPGPADLDFAARFECAAVVFTFLDRNTLNVDYYQPGGTAIDLGVIHRPR